MAAEENEEEDLSMKIIMEDQRKMKPPNKKKFDEDMDIIQSQIKEKEIKYEKLRACLNELKNVETERRATIDRRKRIVVELENLNKNIPEKMRRLNELKSSLVYKSEDKINKAISQLEWNLHAKTFKLTEEKKIVSEIDRLKRSKKTLVQYQALDQEINGIRDRQRKMREERDTFSKNVTQLKMKEDSLRQNYHQSKLLKQEIDYLYEQKRQLVSSFKRQKEEFKDVKEKQRKESLKKKEEERKEYVKVIRKQRVEMEADKLPHEGELHLCHTLITYLSRFGLSVQDQGHEGLSPASSQAEDPEPAEEMDDGQFVLLRKSDEIEDLDFSVGQNRKVRRNRRSRKQSMIKKITHSTDVLAQFMALNLNAPSTLLEVTDSLEELKKKKVFFEAEQQRIESTSDAGFSLTESMLCEMSRQASKTESCEGSSQENVRPDESVYTDLLQACKDETTTGCQELLGAIGGAPESDGSDSTTPKSDSQNSDSTVEGDGISHSSQILVYAPSVSERSNDLDKKNNIDSMKNTPLKSGTLNPAPWVSETEDQNHSPGSDINYLPVPATDKSIRKKSDPAQLSCQVPQKTQSSRPRSPVSLTDIKSYAHSVVNPTPSASSANLYKTSQASSPRFQHSQHLSPPASLSLSVPLTSSLNLPSPTKRPLSRSKTMTPTEGNPWRERRAWAMHTKEEETLSSGKNTTLQINKDKKSPSSPRHHRSPLTPRHSCPLPSDSSSTQKSDVPVLDQDFPPLSHTTSQSRWGSTKSISTSLLSLDHVHESKNLSPSSSMALPSKNIPQPLSAGGSPKGAVSPVQPTAQTNLEMLSSVNQIPGKGKSATELWVESSMAYVQEDVLEADLTPSHRESTRL